MKAALPDRYQVDRRGTPDPNDSAYYVLDVVHDLDARVVLWLLVRRYRYYGPSSRADELEQLLKETDEACTRNIRARNEMLTEKKRGRGRPRSARPRIRS